MSTRSAHRRGAETYATNLEKMTRFVIWLLDRGYLVRVLMGDAAARRAIGDLLAGRAGATAR